METPPLPPEPPSTPQPVPPRRSRAPIIGGFVVGAVIWLLPCAINLLQTRDSYAGVLFLIFPAFILSPSSLVLAIIRRTRRVGLGLLLACGLGWLILGAMCGGVFR